MFVSVLIDSKLFLTYSAINDNRVLFWVQDILTKGEGVKLASTILSYTPSPVVSGFSVDLMTAAFSVAQLVCSASQLNLMNKNLVRHPTKIVLLIKSFSNRGLPD